jgi:hypothetical protein
MALINEMEVEQTLDKVQELEVKNYLVALMRTNLPPALLTIKGRRKTNFPVDIRALCSISLM